MSSAFENIPLDVFSFSLLRFLHPIECTTLISSLSRTSCYVIARDDRIWEYYYEKYFHHPIPSINNHNNNISESESIKKQRIKDMVTAATSTAGAASSTSYQDNKGSPTLIRTAFPNPEPSFISNYELFVRKYASKIYQGNYVDITLSEPRKDHGSHFQKYHEPCVISRFNLFSANIAANSSASNKQSGENELDVIMICYKNGLIRFINSKTSKCLLEVEVSNLSQTLSKFDTTTPTNNLSKSLNDSYNVLSSSLPTAGAQSLFSSDIESITSLEEVTANSSTSTSSQQINSSSENIEPTLAGKQSSWAKEKQQNSNASPSPSQTTYQFANLTSEQLSWGNKSKSQLRREEKAMRKAERKAMRITSHKSSEAIAIPKSEPVKESKLGKRAKRTLKRKIEDERLASSSPLGATLEMSITTNQAPLSNSSAAGSCASSVTDTDDAITIDNDQLTQPSGIVSTELNPFDTIKRSGTSTPLPIISEHRKGDKGKKGKKTGHALYENSVFFSFPSNNDLRDEDGKIKEIPLAFFQSDGTIAITRFSVSPSSSQSIVPMSVSELTVPPSCPVSRESLGAISASIFLKANQMLVLAIGHKSGDVTLWNSHTSQYLGILLQDRPGQVKGEVKCLVYNDSVIYVGYGSSNCLVGFNIVSKFPVNKFCASHLHSGQYLNPKVILVSKDAVVSANTDGTLVVWRKDRCTLVSNFQAHNGAINCAALADWTNVMIITGGQDSQIRLWYIDMERSEEKELMYFDPKAVAALRRSSQHMTDAQIVVELHKDQNRRSESQLSPPSQVSLQNKKGNQKGASSNIPTNQKASGNAKVGEGSLIILKGHSSPINEVVIDKTRIISSSDDGNVRVWELRSAHLGNVLRIIKGIKGGKVQAMKSVSNLSSLRDIIVGYSNGSVLKYTFAEKKIFHFAKTQMTNIPSSASKTKMISVPQNTPIQHQQQQSQASSSSKKSKQKKKVQNSFLVFDEDLRPSSKHDDNEDEDSYERDNSNVSVAWLPHQLFR